jgi:hypothetical protein
MLRRLENEANTGEFQNVQREQGFWSVEINLYRIKDSTRWRTRTVGLDHTGNEMARKLEPPRAYSAWTLRPLQMSSGHSLQRLGSYAEDAW